MYELNTNQEASKGTIKVLRNVNRKIERIIATEKIFDIVMILRNTTVVNVNVNQLIEYIEEMEETEEEIRFILGTNCRTYIFSCSKTEILEGIEEAKKRS